MNQNERIKQENRSGLEHKSRVPVRNSNKQLVGTSKLVRTVEETESVSKKTEVGFGFRAKGYPENAANETEMGKKEEK